MSRFRRLPLSSIVPVLLSLFSVVPAHAVDEAYVIGAADLLEVQVWDNKDLNQVTTRKLGNAPSARWSAWG